MDKMSSLNKFIHIQKDGIDIDECISMTETRVKGSILVANGTSIVFCVF